MIFLIMGLIAGTIYYRARRHDRQLSELEQLACTDSRYQLPNLRYLERHREQILRRIRREQKSVHVFLVLFAASPTKETTFHDRHALDGPLKEAARLLAGKDWTAEIAAGTMTGELLCLCIADNPQMMLNLAAESITDLTPEAPNIIWHAGFCPLAGFSLAQAEENAALACQEAKEKNIRAKLWQNAHS
jgi:hypothetical protein